MVNCKNMSPFENVAKEMSCWGETRFSLGICCNIIMNVVTGVAKERGTSSRSSSNDAGSKNDLSANQALY